MGFAGCVLVLGIMDNWCGGIIGAGLLLRRTIRKHCSKSARGNGVFLPKKWGREAS
jgi:hypothetical protein